jgi:hypothetical protein
LRIDSEESSESVVQASAVHLSRTETAAVAHREERQIDIVGRRRRLPDNFYLVEETEAARAS